jgi:Rps23 Pro-64 3,4-dihydroxylase Tpa1-like proline 4-hydroxylase
LNRIPPHLVLDQFLPESIHDALLDHAAASTDAYERTGVVRQGKAGLIPADRQSWNRPDGLGPGGEEFIAFVSARREDIAARLKIPPFEVDMVETELVAHRHGDFYGRHIDTFLHADRAGRRHNRVLTMVYYLHAQPRRFSGGELALYPFGGGEPVLIEPHDNRLLAFPSFALHEVRRVEAPDEPLAAARFAINVWFNRVQDEPA